MRIATAALLAALPVVAHAQGVQVPALMGQYNADASSDARGARASASASTANVNLTGAAPNNAPVPSYMPPPVQPLSPSAPLSPKETRAIALVQKWKARKSMPTADADGTVRYAFGATIPTLVCSPLYVCGIRLQPGEFIQTSTVLLGDKVDWSMTPTIAGTGVNATTIIAFKPHDAGLQTNVMFATDRRVYSIILKSTQTHWMPLLAFTYPEDQDSAWASYGQAASTRASAAATPPTYDDNYRLSGDNPDWKPRRVLTDGSKTYIEFPAAAMHAQTPSLVGLIDQGWLSKDAEQQLNYRTWGNQIIVDQVLTKAALVYGVGGQQTRVVIERKSAR